MDKQIECTKQSSGRLEDIEDNLPDGWLKDNLIQMRHILENIDEYFLFREDEDKGEKEGKEDVTNA